MNLLKDPNQKYLVLDCNIWIKLLSASNKDLWYKIIKNNYNILISSYMVVEILRVLKRLTIKHHKSFSSIETNFWSFLNHENVIKVFKDDISTSLIQEIKQLPEYQIIAKTFDLELKDVPYLVIAFQYKAILLSVDYRSLINKRKRIYQVLGINLMSDKEFLERELD